MVACIVSENFSAVSREAEARSLAAPTRHMQENPRVRRIHASCPLDEERESSIGFSVAY